MGVLRSIGRWLFDRLALGPIVDVLTHHKVPPELATKKGWMYVFGFATLTAFAVQVLTGAALVTKYIPSPAHAHGSLLYLTESWFGSVTRAMHYFGASAMVLFTFVHMARVYLTGSYKFPREMGWISGVLLLVLVLAMALTGQLLRWDENGVWTVVVASKFAGRVPLIGRELTELILAGDTVGGTTLTRFFAIHVFILPALIVLLVGLHLYLVYVNGISEPPKAGRPVDPKTYRAWYQGQVERFGPPYFPEGLWREIVVSAALVGAIVTLAVLVGPRGPGAPPDPTELTTDPRPDWYVRWYYALLWVKPRGWEDVYMVYAPIGVLFLLLLLPLVAGRGERSPVRRVWSIGIVGLATGALAYLIVLGTRAPWSPAVGTQPLSAAELRTTDEHVLRGAELFHDRGCQYCHAVLGRGGRYGPALTDVALRLSPAEITVRTLNGIGNMPAYLDLLSAEEISAILAFLRAVGERGVAAGDRP